MDRYTQVSSENWFSRIGKSFKNIFGGIILVLGAIVLLWWNEGRAVKTAKGLEEGADNVIVLSEPVIEESNDNKLIHFHGNMMTEDSLYDHEFKIAVQAIKIKRSVEMYQWKEETKSSSKKKVGGGKETTTEYNYDKVWSSNLIDSDKFEYKEGHENPDDFPYDNLEDYADNVIIGEFTIPEAILNKLADFEGIILDNNNLPYAKGTIVKESDKGQTIHKIFLGNGTKSSPKVGDVKIAFYQIPNDEYSIIAKQESGMLKAYATKTGTEILMISPGNVSSKEMFESAMNANSGLTWGLRFAGFILMFIGFVAMTSLLETVADIVPFLGTLVGLGIKLFAGIVSFLISMVIIGMAWIYYRPLLGGILIVIGLTITLFFYKKSLNNKSV